MNCFVAETFARVEKKDQALIYLRKAFDEGSSGRTGLMQDKEFANLRVTPEFWQSLVQEHVHSLSGE
jgi:hypothetical protein